MSATSLISWSIYNRNCTCLILKPIKQVCSYSYPLEKVLLPICTYPCLKSLLGISHQLSSQGTLHPLLPDNLSHRVVYGMPVSMDICLLDFLSSGDRSGFFSHKSKALSRSLLDQVCSFLFFPGEASLLIPILCLSLPWHSSFGGHGLLFFCLTTTTEMVTHLVITRLTFRSILTCLLFALKKVAQKRPFCWF